MKIHQIKPKHKRKNKSRIARGNAGKKGTTAGRGSKGQKSRSGYNLPKGFEGGQTKLSIRTPKAGGFKSSQIKNVIIKSSLINKFFSSIEVVSSKNLFKKGLIKNKNQNVKILYDEKLKSPIKITNCSYSNKVARQIIKID